RERPTKFTRGSFHQKVLFLPHRYQDRCIDFLWRFHFHELISKMENRLWFEMTDIFLQDTQIGLRNLGLTERETEQWGWLEQMQQRLAEQASCSDDGAETNCRATATHQQVIDDLWHVA